MVAAAGVIFLLSPVGPIPPPPPLPASPNAIRGNAEEQRFFGHIDSRERVVVGVAADGTPVRIVATQRFELSATGDYFFVVPAPAERIQPGPGTESAPGLRDLGIVWQGFSNKHRTLSATVTLRTPEAAPGLPLEIEVEGSTVTLRNATKRTLTAVTGTTSRAALEGVLRRLRAAFEHSPTGVVAGLWQVDGEPARQAPVEVSAPLHVTGTIGGRPIDTVLGRGRPLERVYRVPAGVKPNVALRVELFPPLRILPTPAELARSPRPLETMQAGLGSVATSWWFRHYLGSPDLLGPASATYLYRTVRKTAPPPAVTSSGGNDTLWIVLGVALGLAALGGLAVLWSRS